MFAVTFGWDWGLGSGIRIEIGDWDLRFRLGIGDWDWELRLGNGIGE